MAILNTQHGDIAVDNSDYLWGGTTYSKGAASIDVDAHVEPDAQGATLDLRLRGADEADLEDAVQLLAFGQQLVAQINAAQGPQRAAAQREAEEQRQREAAEEEEAQQLWAGRSEQLLTEFLEEKGRIRLKGMKRWRPVTVKAQEQGDDEFVPYFEYVYDKHGWREHWGRHVQEFEIKVGSRYRHVWGDKADLHPYDQQSQPKRVRNYQGGDLA